MTLTYDPPDAGNFLSTKSYKIWAELCFLFEFKKCPNFVKVQNHGKFWQNSIPS